MSLTDIAKKLMGWREWARMQQTRNVAVIAAAQLPKSATIGRDTTPESLLAFASPTRPTLLRPHLTYSCTLPTRDN